MPRYNGSVILSMSKPTKYTLKELTANAKDIKSETVAVPEWDLRDGDGNVIQAFVCVVKGLNGSDRADLLQNATMANGRPDYKKLYPLVVQLCTYDPETGMRVFDREDIPMLNEKSGSALDRIATKALELSGLSNESKDVALKN